MNTYDAKAGLAEVSSFNVVGLSAQINNENDAAASQINALWERFFKDSIGQMVENRENDVIYAVYSGYEGDHTKPYTLTLGYRVPNSIGQNWLGGKQGEHDHILSLIEVKAGDYAVLSASGQQPQALMSTWEAVWSSDFDRMFATDFEVYGPRFFEDGVNEVLVHIGVNI